MCGITGIINLSQLQFGLSEKKLFRDLLVATSLRGKHSTGMFTVPTDNSKPIKIFKRAMCAGEYIETNEFALMMKDFNDYKEFDFKNMTDVQFMYEFYWTQPYHFVHFDGPHMTKDVLTEAIFFANRSVKGTRFVFDDYPKYEMDQIAFALTYFNFKTKEAGENKIMLERHA